MLKHIQLNIQTYNQWQRVSPILVSRYEDMAPNLGQEALRIGNFMEIDISESFASELAKNIRWKNKKRELRK